LHASELWQKRPYDLLLRISLTLVQDSDAFNGNVFIAIRHALGKKIALWQSSMRTSGKIHARKQSKVWQFKQLVHDFTSLV
jgi:hypothetical protein